MEINFKKFLTALLALWKFYVYSGLELFNQLRYITSNTRHKLNQIINKLNKEESVSLAERIILNKYLTRFPNLVSGIKEASLKFS
tara:strand:+ start:361 stop:615 length:255 start_codon:yes stop_codon:yes gene_type:complete